MKSESAMLCLLLLCAMLPFTSAGLNTAPFAKRKNWHHASAVANSQEREKKIEDLGPTINPPTQESTFPSIIDLSVVGCYQHVSDLSHLDSPAVDPDSVFTFSESAYFVTNMILAFFLLFSTIVRFCSHSKSTRYDCLEKPNRFAMMYVPSHPHIGPKGVLNVEDEKARNTSNKESKAPAKANLKSASSKLTSISSKKKDADSDKNDRNSKEKMRQRDRSSERGISSTRKSAGPGKLAK
jgi:hypothetical protein